MRPSTSRRFHPLVEKWFSETFGEPTAPQSAGWSAIEGGADVLIAAPTGSGKTLAAFLWAINGLVEQAAGGTLEDRTSIVYVSPLKALANDIQKNLQTPLAAIGELAASSGAGLPEIRVAVRTGDTPARERNLMIRKPPHILITTPESLYILLTAERSRNFLKTASTVIVDEIHAVAGDKRGAHLALSLERLDLLAEKRLQRIGLSATQKPIMQIAQLLIGAGRVDGRGEPDCSIVDVGHQREWELTVEVPSQVLGPIASHEMWAETYDRIVQLSKQHRTTLVFVNTRRLVERVSHALSNRLGEGKVAAHHGSLSRKIRLQAEQGLKSGEVPVVVATASLELGIDIGHVEVVCHVGAPRALATMLQRVGRSGHWLGAIPKGVMFPLTRDELVTSAAAVRAASAGELDRVVIPEMPLDILAQQVVATAATGEIGEEEMFRMARRAYHYRDLPREEFDQVVEMLSEGVASRRGRRGAHLHHDRVNAILKGRRGARLAAITGGGAIPDVADYDVVAEPDEIFVGKVNEDFAIESMAGDIFLLGNTSWRIRRVEAGKVRVEDAQGLPPTIPFWLGEAPARTRELSEAVSDLREKVAEMIGGTGGNVPDKQKEAAWLVAECGVAEAGAEQIVDYIAETLAALGCVPTMKTIVAERFFDESGGMQLVMHTPFGGRINRAWGLALRKRFCVTFDFELQAAATDDGVVLSLGEQHSFPLDSVFGFVKTPVVEDTLIQAVLPSPMFTNRWRWNATRSLALLRHSGGRKVPAPIQRMRAEDLLAAVFPEQVACQENTVGPIIPPDHPLVNETIRNCLHEAMDLDGLTGVLGALERGELRTVAVETPTPSPMSHEILNANPFAFLDDAPLEERRARAVALRRTDPQIALGAGALDAAAIDEVREQARPDIRDPDELHDLMLSVGIVPAEEAARWEEFVATLISSGRVTIASWDRSGILQRAYVAAERMNLVAAAIPNAEFDPQIELPARPKEAPAPSSQDAVKVIVRGWMQVIGPATASDIAGLVGLGPAEVDLALLSLEGSGEVLRGHFTPGRQPSGETEWCDRRLLARIHRLTVGRLRAEIQPVTPAEFMRFLFRWQHVQPGTLLHGRDGLIGIVTQLQGLELPAPAWEEKVLPARIARYDPADLEYLCLSGVVAWGRIAQSDDSPESEPQEVARRNRRRPGPARNSPIAFVMREDLNVFASHRDREPSNGLSSAAREVMDFLEQRGASFLAEVTKGTHRMHSEVEDALWELVSAGLVSGDGIAGLRHLLKGSKTQAHRHGRLRALQGTRTRARALPVGRWAVWGNEVAAINAEERSDAIARQLLRRYGVVFRDVLAREREIPSWRILVNIYRRWEAQGTLRGGRFVGGFAGEQFALPEAVEALRSVRRAGEDADTVIISAADPLNFAGILLPGPRISPFSALSIAFRNGVVADVAPLGTLRTRLWTPSEGSTAT